jgi:hypothetical protein
VGKLLHISELVQQQQQPAAQLPATRRPQRPALPAAPARRYSADLVPAGLSPSVNAAALLLCNTAQKPARELPTLDLTSDLLKPVSLVPFLLGHSKTLLEGSDLVAMATAVAEMVQQQFPALTLPEIALALRRGASGEWKKPDELLLPSLPVIRSWLKAYTTGTRADALQVLQLASAQQLSLPVGNAEHDYPRQVAAGMANIKAAGHVPALLDTGGLFYRWLKRIGAFAGFGNPRRMMIKECLLLVRRGPRDKVHRSFAEQLRAGWPAAHPLAPKVLIACQKRLLAGWVRYHNARGTDMQTWLQQLADASSAPQTTSPDEPRKKFNPPHSAGSAR